MPLSNAQRQLRHRERVKEKLARLDEITNQGEYRMHGTLKQNRSFTVEHRKRPTLSRPKPANDTDHAVVAVLGAMSKTLDAGVPYRRVETIEMSVAEWTAIPSNPRQRDEVVRLEKNRASHILDPDEKHREVAMAVLPDGSRYKVDGHTRTAAWKMGLVAAPASLLVDVYACADIAAAQQLYDRFDNTTAAESGTDRVTGAYRQAGISPQSPMLRSGEISTAVRQLYHYLTRTSPKKETKNEVINKGVLLFAKEIKAIDAISPTRALFPTGIMMGALLSFAAEPDAAMEFWSAYATGGGMKLDGRMDAVQALHERRMVDRRKANSVKDAAMMATAVAAVAAHTKGTTYTIKHGITAKTKDVLRRYAEAVMAKKEGK